LIDRADFYVHEPERNAISRITSSVTSVEIPKIFSATKPKSFPYSYFLRENRQSLFQFRPVHAEKVNKIGAVAHAIKELYLARGLPEQPSIVRWALMVTTVQTGLIPSFCGRGVPE